ncbi:MAG: MFS transporter [Pseudomonadota bacterium]
MPAGRDPLLWRIPGYYFAYFAALGIFLPFWPLYLKEEGFSPAAIGLLMGLFGLTKLAGPPIVGWLSDHLGQPMRWVRAASLLTLILFSTVFAGHGLWGMALVMALFTLAWNAAMPQFDAVTLQHLGEKAYRYARIRLWGSVGFIVTALGVGPLLDLWGAGMLPWGLVLAFAGMSMLAMAVPGPAEEAGHRTLQTGPVPVLPILRRPEVFLFLGASLLLQASHGTYYAFYSVHLEQHGHSKALTGALWALGVLAEVVIFLVVHRWLPRYGAVRLMQLTLLLTTLRWALIGALPESVVVLTLAQLLHAFSFGVAHAASVEFIRQHFTDGTQGRGQALLSSVCYGAGGVLGFWLAGVIWQWFGALPSFAISAGMALAGALLLGPAMQARRGG